MHQDMHETVEYKAVLTFIDDTRGSHCKFWTTRCEWFDTLDKLAAFCNNVIRRGYRYTSDECEGIADITASDIRTFRVSIVELDSDSILEIQAPRKMPIELGIKGQVGQ